MTAGRLPYGYPVVKGGSGNELLIETQQAFYVFFRPKTTTSNIDSKSVEDLLFQHRVLRVSIQPNSNGYVAFEVAEEAEEFEKRIILESVYEPITPDEWYNDIDKWLQDKASNKIKQDIAGCEERLDKLNARFQENPTIGLQTAIQIEGESLGKLEECLIRLQSKIEKSITTLKGFLQSRKWSEDAEASLLKAIDDLRQHQPYAVDPNRQYSLVYKKGQFMGGTYQAGELELEFARRLDDSYWLVEPYDTIYIRRVVKRMDTQNTGLYLNQMFRNLNQIGNTTSSGVWAPLIRASIQLTGQQLTRMEYYQ
ncbi:hypothetical protein L211DRAFT_718821 [Terfezia boudieri ATCC MYA-4762]|uniref:Uncharacterized protein n=1 Tax=Terfezia boudieri ATCC MYA-4762 TaxID=1051890 RepID=A0A3N4LL57_9PEZI|nr:hypothetical protein L211DRAFT_718821 [Terfezia boudieri ATCC MYA-4762]